MHSQKMKFRSVCRNKTQTELVNLLVVLRDLQTSWPDDMFFISAIAITRAAMYGY